MGSDYFWCALCVNDKHPIPLEETQYTSFDSAVEILPEFPKNLSECFEVTCPQCGEAQRVRFRRNQPLQILPLKLGRGAKVVQIRPISCPEDETEEE